MTPSPYSEATQRRFEMAAHAGELTGPGVGRGAAGSPTAGTWVQFDVQLGPGDPAARRIEAARFRAYGCPHTIAAADWICETAAGSPAGPGLPESLASLRERFAVPIPKMGRLLIIEDAWAAALAAARNLAA